MWGGGRAWSARVRLEVLHLPLLGDECSRISAEKTEIIAKLEAPKLSRHRKYGDRFFPGPHVAVAILVGGELWMNSRRSHARVPLRAWERGCVWAQIPSVTSQIARQCPLRLSGARGRSFSQLKTQTGADLSTGKVGTSYCSKIATLPLNVEE